MLLGNTGLNIEKNGFGALPIQRIPTKDAINLLHKAFDGGMNYFDTARMYTDSEEKLGKAFEDRWNHIILASKTAATTTEVFWEELETSLRLLKRDHIDVYQWHNPASCPLPGKNDGLYEAMEEAKKQGKIRFISITNHRINVAWDAIKSGLYSTLQFPMSYLSTEEELELVRACKEKGMGFIAMKGLSGGMITNSRAAYAWMHQFDNTVPIWGIQREWELDEFLSHMKNPPIFDKELQEIVEADRKELGGEFCRGCGYCMPCTKDINISVAARASLMMRRGPSDSFLNEQGQKMMKKVEECIDCGYCISKCPYGLNTPALLRKNYKDFQEVLAGKPL